LVSVLVLAAAGVTTFLLLNKEKPLSAPNGSILPQLSHPDAVFFEGDGFSITYGEIYEQFKANDGINQMLFMIDTYLLSAELAAVTNAQIEDKIKYLTYGTLDDAIIAKYSDDEKGRMETNYSQNILLLGYQDDPTAYARMLIAKEKVVEIMMTNSANSTKTWYVNDVAIKNDYVVNYFEDVTAIKIRFFSETDAKTAMRQLNLVSYQGDLRLYTGTRPIEEVASNGFNDTNTRTMTAGEILLAYIRLYNYAYAGWKTPLSEDLTEADILADASFNQVFTELRSVQSGLATYLFSSLNSKASFDAGTNANIYYSYQPLRYAGSNDTAHYMVLKLTGTPKPDLSNFTATSTDLVERIGRPVYDAIKAKLIKSYLDTSGFVSERMGEYRKNAGLVIHDYYLGVDYKSIATDYELDKVGHLQNIASLPEGFVLTADELLAFALQKNAALYTIYASQLPAILAAHFDSEYCRNETAECVFDPENNKLASIQKHFDDLAKLKASYEESYYRIYYTFEEYIYLAYGAKSDADMIRYYYVKTKLQPFLIYDQLVKNNWAMVDDYFVNLVEDYYDNYFSLNAKTLLIFVDRDENGTPDDYQTFLSGLSDRAAYDQILQDFETAIRAYVVENQVTNFSTIVAAYGVARRNDPVWGVFKQFGFGLNAGNPSSSGSITYLNTIDMYEDALVEGFQATYAQYLLPANVAKTGIYYDQLVETKAGMYLIYAEKGTNFVKPTGKFTMTYTSSGIPNYTVGTENASDVPTAMQLKIFSEKRFYEIVYGTDDTVGATYGVTVPKLPTSLLTAMDVYYTKLHDSVYVVGFLNIVVGDLLRAGTFVNAHPAYCSLSEAQIKASIEQIQALYHEQVFGALDTTQD
jgi:hypothetical protein